MLLRWPDGGVCLEDMCQYRQGVTGALPARYNLDRDYTEPDRAHSPEGAYPEDMET